jgi:hypothetical protein
MIKGRGAGRIVQAMAAVMLLQACAPDFVDERSALSPAANPAMSAAEPLEQGSVIPTSPKPEDVVTPPPVPNPGQELEPKQTAPLPPADNRTPPPTRPVWPAPPPNYNAARPDAAPLGIPNRPPASWRY